VDFASEFMLVGGSETGVVRDERERDATRATAYAHRHFRLRTSRRGRDGSGRFRAPRSGY